MTLVANDTGGAITQLLLTRRPERVAPRRAHAVRRVRELPAAGVPAVAVDGEGAAARRGAAGDADQGSAPHAAGLRAAHEAPGSRRTCSRAGCVLASSRGVRGDAKQFTAGIDKSLTLDCGASGSVVRTAERRPPGRLTDRSSFSDAVAERTRSRQFPDAGWSRWRRRRDLRCPARPARAPSRRIIDGMLLVVDVGNTQTHFGTFRRGRLVEHWRFATVRESTADELGAALRNLLELRGVGLADLDALDRLLDGPAARARVGARWPPLPRPRDAGRRPRHEDRDADPHRQPARARRRPARQRGRRVRAGRRRRASCVDFGTAITYDVVSADGEYLGGDHRARASRSRSRR